MAMDSIDFTQIYISYNGYVIDKKEFGEADIEISSGGDQTESKRGYGGGAETVLKNDKIDTLTFTLRGSALSAFRLQQYHNNHTAIDTGLIVKDLNPMRQRTWTSNGAYVKSYDSVKLGQESAFAFTIECEDNFELAGVNL